MKKPRMSLSTAIALAEVYSSLLRLVSAIAVDPEYQGPDGRRAFHSVRDTCRRKFNRYSEIARRLRGSSRRDTLDFAS